MAETSTVDPLLARATGVEAMEHVGVSGAQLFRLQLDGEPHVLKYLDWDGDSTLRASGIPEGAVSPLWTQGVLDRLPAYFKQPIVAVIPGPPTAVLMRDVGRWLVPNDHAPVPPRQHVRFLNHMAEMHVEFWNGGPEMDAVSAATRFAELGPAMGVREARSGARVPALVGKGWPRLAELAPQAAEIVIPLADDPTPLVDALADTPQTLVHGSLRFENLGTDDAGRTVVIDWELPGRGAPLSQLALSLLGGLVWFGWWKALERRSEERDWWVRAALEGTRYL